MYKWHIKIIAKFINNIFLQITRLKVLHLSKFGLHDWHIEKSAITAKRKGFDVYFEGEKNVHEYRNITFNKIFEFPWNIKAKCKLPLSYQILKK